MVLDSDPDDQTLVVLLGGGANAVAVARALGRNGVPVAVVARQRSSALHSKYAQPHLIPEARPAADYYREILLERPVYPEGSLLFPCEDGAIQFIVQHNDALQKRYRLDLQRPEHRLYLLDKQKTLELARQAGIAAPGFWTVRSMADVEALLGRVDYPLLIKPIHSHVFQRRFRKKLFCVENETELIESSQTVLEAGVDFMLCEFIPGPDNLLNSYYVYIDRDNQPRLEFTKRVLRRSPPNFGGGSYHITEWLPRTAEAGYRFFSAIGFQGLGNIEFKTDPRDGQLKVIECNARFTAAQELVTRSGLNMPYMIYRYLTRGEHIASTGFAELMTLWLPFQDFDAYRDLRSLKQISSLDWLRSICRPQVFSYFDLDDPGPFLNASRREIRVRAERLCKWL